MYAREASPVETRGDISTHTAVFASVFVLQKHVYRFVLQVDVMNNLSKSCHIMCAQTFGHADGRGPLAFLPMHSKMAYTNELDQMAHNVSKIPASYRFCNCNDRGDSKSPISPVFWSLVFICGQPRAWL